MKKNHLPRAITAFILSLASLTLPPISDLHAAEIFTKVTAGPGRDAGYSLGAAWGDYDGDGFIDLFVVNTGPVDGSSASHFLYHNNANGTFSRVTNGPVAAVVSEGFGGAWGDYDNDGHLDLVLVNWNQPNYLFHNNGDGSFAAVPNASIVSDIAEHRSVTWVDYDSDGYVDLFSTTGTAQPRRLYHNNHDGTFTRITQGAFLTVPGAFLGVAWGDYNNDGRPDLFLPQAASGLPNYLYRNDTNGTFTRVGVGTFGSSSSIAAAWGDFDNDGDLDLFVSCARIPDGPAAAGRPNLFYRNDGNDTFTSLTSLPANDPENQGGASTGCKWGDYDNDGWLDLFVANRFGNDFLYHNNGNGTFAKITNSIAVNDGGSWASAWGDYDNDGFLDLFVGGYDAASFLYHNNTNDNHWLKFRLIGTQSNRAAIGAKVRVQATINGQSFWQMREVSGGDGTMGQNSLHVHVGLGNATNVDLVRIEWPSGIVQEFRDVAANQGLTIQESVVDIFPAEADVSLGATLTLSVTNAPPDSTLQWRLNGVDIAGATNATLEFSNAITNLNGQYTIVVSNATGLIFPRPAVVRVFDRPIITSQPQSTNVLAGTNVTLNVAAISLSPISYQWQFNGVDLPGQTSSSLTLTNTQLAQDGLYTAVASDVIGSVTSQPAALRILIKPVIVQVPLSQSVVTGGSVTFSVEVTGNPAPFLYQWRQVSAVLTNMVLSEKKAFLTLNNIQPSQAGLYRVVVTNAALPSLSLSATCNLTVLPDADGDGLPDAWETAHGLNPASASDAPLDGDGDGLSNLAEYRSGTSPTNAASLLKLESVTQANGQATVSFNASSNQTYSVEWCAQPDGGAWSRLDDVLARPSDRIENVTDSNTGEAARFYRVVTPRRP